MSTLKNIKKHTFNCFADKRGYLLPIDLDMFDFQPKRIFVVNGVPVGSVRGNHSHYKTKQYLICTRGSVNVMLDDGTTTKTITLTQNESVLIPELVWDSQEFLTENAEILVVCSTKYDINDYILTYDEFINTVNNG